VAHGEHKYRVSVEWTGNRGTGTSGYREYGRDHAIRAGRKPDIPGSSDAAFLGDAARWNPEDLLVASASACHKLWYLHLAEVTMVDNAQRGQFTQIVLRPHVTIRAGGDRDLAEHLHHAAHEKCYVANSVNFPIVCEPTIEVAPA
jgi:organic hydroperoxide reductase OsmC/OhrA